MSRLLVFYAGVHEVHWCYDGINYRTNGNGEGIWKINPNGVTSHQIMGTTQFNLKGLSNSSIRRRIQRFHSD